jgi:hypothetical protein
MIRVLLKDGTQRHYYNHRVEDHNFLVGFDGESNLYTTIPVRNILMWVNLDMKGDPKDRK